VIFPPSGSALDSWSDDEPSQRAILIRAIRQTPRLLEAAIDRSRSWHGVVAYVTGHLNELRDDVEADERDLTRRKAEEPSGRHATLSIKAILNRIADS
jgi:hypothetical protein